jgi:hypothetical protein
MYSVCNPHFSNVVLDKGWPSVGSMKMKMKLSYLLVSASAFLNAVNATVNITELITDTPKCAVSKVPI